MTRMLLNSGFTPEASLEAAAALAVSLERLLWGCHTSE